MSASFSQRFLHWLELGGGSLLVVRFAIALVTAAVMAYAGWQRFEGPDDRTMEQALVGRALAEGQGYSTPILWPQSLAVLRENAQLASDWQPGQTPLPELYHAPGYPTLIGGLFKTMGGGREWFFAPPSMEGSKWMAPYRADILLLVLNVACGLLAALGTGLLAEKMFNPMAGLIALSGVATSLALGDAIASVDGTAILAFGTMLLGWAWFGLARAGLESSSKGAVLWATSGAVVLGALYLTEYTAGLLIFPWLLSAGFCTKGKLRIAVITTCVLTFALLVAPWSVRNIRLTGHPMGLAGQSLVLKSGDPTAEPLDYRNTESIQGPEFSARKILNKGLKGVETVFSSRIWSGGAQFMGAFALASLLYRFRQERTSLLRWGWVGAWVFVSAGQFFFASGESPRLAAIWLSPLLLVLGAGFFMVLLDNLRQPSALVRAVVVSLIIFLNGLPIIHNLTEPKGYPFRAPLHLPGRMSVLGQRQPLDFFPGNLFVTDAPAALAWYGRISVWSLPNTYLGLMDLHRRFPLAGVLLTPRTWDQPLFSKVVVKARIEAQLSNPGKPLTEVAGWAPVWGEIFRQVVSMGQSTVQLPRSFPFGKVILMPDLWLGQTVLLVNPLAQKPVTSTR